MATPPGNFQAWEERRLKNIYSSLVQLTSEHLGGTTHVKKKKTQRTNNTFQSTCGSKLPIFSTFFHDLAYPTRQQKSSIQAVQNQMSLRAGHHPVIKTFFKSQMCTAGLASAGNCCWVSISDYRLGQKTLKKSPHTHFASRRGGSRGKVFKLLWTGTGCRHNIGRQAAPMAIHTKFAKTQFWLSLCPPSSPSFNI